MKTLISMIVFALALVVAPVASAGELTSEAQTMVNINTADAEELDKYLDGIGKTKAQAIVDYRNENGVFESIKDLDEVKGIGASIIDKNRDRITL